MSSLPATGYVHEMLDKKMDFTAFAMRCARAFGALVLMRDDPADAPIPDVIEPIPYYRDSVVQSRAKVAELEAMNLDQQLEYGERCKTENLAMLLKSRAKQAEDVARCREMLVAVEAWEPPSEDHVSLKKFMLEQIESSITYADDGYYDSRIAEIKGKDALHIYTDALEQARQRIPRDEKQWAEEQVRAAERTKWIQQLRASLTNQTAGTV